MDVVGMGEGDGVVDFGVAHGWDADTSTPLDILQLRTDAGDVGLMSLGARPGAVARRSDWRCHHNRSR